jgi:hypothetical protein
MTTQYYGTYGDGIPPMTRVHFVSLEEYVEYCKEGSETRKRMDPGGIVGPLDRIRAVDTHNGEYAPVYFEDGTDARGNPRRTARGGEYVGGRELNDKERAKLKKLEG